MTFDGSRTPARYRRAFSTTAVSLIGSGSWVTVSGFSTAFPGFSTTTFGVADNVVVTYGLGVITADVDCWIEARFYVELENNSTGRRGIRLAMDGVDNTGVNAGNFQGAVAAGPMRLETHYGGPLAAGHTLTAQVYQDSGSSLDMTWRQLTIDATAL